jgi:peptidoglycan/LPS O-acetylase OafA/YrhL
LRFAFAATVLLNHSFILGGFGSDDPLMFWSHGQISLASMAVDGFFVLSGYLITRSYMSSPSTVRYVWRRFIRIFPGFWVCLILTAAVFAPIVLIHERGTLSGADWLGGDESPVSYVLGNGLLNMHQWMIWHLFSTVPLTQMQANFGVDPGANAFDRPLWTLRYEFECYLLVAAAGVLGMLRKLKIATVIWTALLAGYLLLLALHPVQLHAPFSDYQRFRLWFMFALGALAYLYGRHIPMRWWYGLVATAVLVGTLAFGGYEVAGRIAFAYVCMWMSIYLPLRRFDARGDFSYGVYIYGWLVAQMLADYNVYKLGLIDFLAITAMISLALAFLSWHLVEAPAQRLRSIRFRSLPLPLGWWPKIRWAGDQQ